MGKDKRMTEKGKLKLELLDRVSKDMCESFIASHTPREQEWHPSTS
jgi:hypothetical protein